ncbi:hypothetical protein TNCV_523881 [Trichonephila clavipes]|nr:hypothetical protein TNCV_523881 [Trichonephila clavipes]
MYAAGIAVIAFFLYGGSERVNGHVPSLPLKVRGRGSRVVKVSDRGWPCHEFGPSTTKDPPCTCVVYTIIESCHIDCEKPILQSSWRRCSIKVSFSVLALGLSKGGPLIDRDRLNAHP